MQLTVEVDDVMYSDMIRDYPVIVKRTVDTAVAQALAALARTPGPPLDARELVVGTKVAPPFAMKAEDGTWRGISIDLWRRVADQTQRPVQLLLSSGWSSGSSLATRPYSAPRRYWAW